MNSASRIYPVVVAITQHPTNDTAADVWARVLGVPEGTTDADSLVVRRLGMLQQQLKALRTALGPKANSPIFKPHLLRLEHTFRLRNLGLPWDSAIRNQMPETTREVLGSWAEMLPADGFELGDELEALILRIAEIRRELEVATDLDLDLQAFLLNQLDIMESALRDSRWGGPEPIIEAIDRAAQCLAQNSSLVKGAAEEALVQQVWEVWARIRSLGGSTLRIGMLATWLLVDVPDALRQMRKWLPQVEEHQTKLPLNNPPLALPPAPPTLEEDDEDHCD